MKGLLIKDFYVLIKQMRVFLLMVIVFAVVPGYNMTIFAVVYSAMMPYTALAYDERSHWEQLAGMMPYTNREIILSKYVLGWIFTAGSALISAVAGMIESRFTDQAASPLVAGLAFCVGVIMMSLTLPPMFRFGVEKGRMLFIVIMVVVACGSAGLVSGIVESPNTVAVIPLLKFALPAAAVAASLISIPISVRAYARRTY